MFKKVVFSVSVLFAGLFFCQGGAVAGEKTRIAVVDFKSESVQARKGLSASLVSDKIASDLVKTGRFNVLERTQIEEVIKEQNFPQVLRGEEYDYQKLGKLLSAEAIITGSVFYGERNITKYRDGDYNPGFFMAALFFPPLLFVPPPQKESYNVKVNTYSVTVRAVDVETGKIIASEDLLEQDLIDVSLAIKRLYVQLLQSYPIRGEVVEIEKDRVYIDLGKDVGVNENDIFEVYKPGKNIMKGTFEVLSVPDEKIGEIEIRNVANTSSICQTIPHLTKEPVLKEYKVKLIPVETLDPTEWVRRYPVAATRPVGMGDAFIGQASGPMLVEYNPAGLAQISKPEIQLGWDLHYNSAGFWMPNTGERISGLRGFYGSYVENPAYPSEFNGVIPLARGALGLHLDVNDMRIDHDVFKFDDGGINLGVYGGMAATPTIMVGAGFDIRDKWVSPHRIVSSVDNSYQFRGTGFGVKGGVLFRPHSRLGIGGVLNLSSKYSGTLKTTGASPAETPFSLDGPSNLALGLSYRPNDSLVCNLDLVSYFTPSWYDSKLGVEYSLTESIALRLGTYNKLIRVPNFANDPNYPSHYDIRSNVYTTGLGYTTDSWFIDLAGEYEVYKDQDSIIYPDYAAGSQTRTLLSSYKEVRVKIGIGAKF